MSWRQSAGPLTRNPVSWAATIASGMPMSASLVVPQCSRPGSSRCPGFRRQKVTVSRAWGAAPRIAPVAPSTPDGTSIATTDRPAVASASTTPRATPSSGRAKPAPNNASTISSAPARLAVDKASTAPAHPAAAQAASPASASLGTRVATRTGQPARCSWRATTQPSPPLLPGPHSTSVGRGANRAVIARETARPAFSISQGPGKPPAIAARSTAAMTAGGSRMPSARMRRAPA